MSIYSSLKHIVFKFEQMHIELASFGHKFGPAPFTTVFDVRKGVFNPFHIVGDRDGTDPDVARIVLENGGSTKVEEILKCLDTYEGPTQVCVGCIGGKDRSVAIVEEVARILRQREGVTVVVTHRDKDK